MHCKIGALSRVFLLMCASTCMAQTPGQNINMVSGKVFPTGDPYLQRQNEPSIAGSSRNASRLLAGANDYRSVNIPAPAGVADETGDAWLGVFKSFDGGATWQSNLLPGYPQDISPQGLASPLHGLSTGADPVVRAGTNGMFYYSGIAFNRGTNVGKVFVARYIDLANKENGDPIEYLDTAIIDQGTSGQFLDKPWLAVDIPRGSGTCTIQATQDGTPVSQTIPAGNIYLTYSDFVGGTNNVHTQILITRSTDCGQTWGKPVKISESYQVNQGGTLAIDPQTGALYVAWRQFSDVNSPNAILISKSVDAGNSFSKPVTVQSLPDYDPNHPTAAAFFDQGISSSTFRTNAFPALAVDGTGRVYLAWSQRGVGPGGDARIVLSTSPYGTSWTAPQPIDNAPAQDDFGSSFSRGSQLMPSLVFTEGTLTALCYDLRLDHTIGEFTPNNPFTGDMTTGAFYKEARSPLGDLPGSPNLVFTPFISDAGLSIRHTLDVRVSEATPADSPVFNSVYVSQYKFGTLGESQPPGTVTQLQQLQVNPPNLPMFQGGTVPFMGDYIDVAGRNFLTPGETGAGWQFNTVATQSPVHFATWTSNQDVRPPADFNWAHYTPPGPGCIPGQEGDKNQNIYFSRITQGLAFSSPQISKPLSTTLQRAFVLDLFNETNLPHSFRLTIANQPAGGTATFDVLPTPLPAILPAPRISIDLTLPPRSGATRTVFATSAIPSKSIAVTATEIVAGLPKANGLTGAVVLNSDPTVPALVNPDSSPGNINVVELYTPNLSDPNLSNPNLSNPNLSNPNLSNVNVSNPNLSNPNLSNPNLSNPNLSNVNVSNPNLSNPNLSNPNLSNPNLSNTAVSDVTYTLTNSGNTNTAYQVRLLQLGSVPTTANIQLILSKSYLTPLGDNCSLVEENTNIPVANIVSPTLIDFSQVGLNTSNNPGADNATLHLAPGETLLITIRGFVDLQTMQNISTVLIPVVRAEAAFSQDNVNKLAAPLTLIPTTLVQAITGQSYTASFIAFGGTAPYTWAVAPGSSLPAGFTLDPSTGTLTNTNPVQNIAGTYNFVLQITDSSQPAKVATRAYSLRVVAPVKITSTVLSDGVVNAAYSYTLAASGGLVPLTWRVTAGNLPAGLSLNSQTASITGSATTAGSYPLTIRVTDTSLPTALFDERSFTLRIAQPLMFSFPSLPDAVTGQPYSFTLTASGGLTPQVWAVTSGALPTGLTLTNGVISGIPTVTNTAGNSFTLTVHDSAAPQQSMSAPFVIHVGSPIAITTPTVPNGVIGLAYPTTTLQAVGGLPPLSWSVASGSLPPGLSLAPVGTISGTPTAAGAFLFSARVTDSSAPQQTATHSYTISVPLPLQVSFIVQPSNSSPNAQITPAIKVQVVDSKGNALNGASVVLTLEVNPGNSVLSGTVSAQTNNRGIAIFASNSLNATGTGYRLRATATYTGNQTGYAISNAFNVR